MDPEDKPLLDPRKDWERRFDAEFCQASEVPHGPRYLFKVHEEHVQIALPEHIKAFVRDVLKEHDAELCKLTDDEIAALDSLGPDLIDRLWKEREAEAERIAKLEQAANEAHAVLQAVVNDWGDAFNDPEESWKRLMSSANSALGELQSVSQLPPTE